MTRSTTVKKLISFALAALSFALITGCFVADGDVYLSFDWTYTPEWFDTDDPNLPDTIYRNVEYPTEEGTWYFEYFHAESGYTRWICYTLTAHDGILPCVPAEDARFELFLSAFEDPDLIQWQSVTGDAAAEPGSISAMQSPQQPDEQRVQTWEDQETSGGWTLEVKGGVIEPAPR
jgi:hypothetical protein